MPSPNQPMIWSPIARLAVVPIVIAGVFGLLLCALLVLGLLLLGMKPIEAL